MNRGPGRSERLSESEAEKEIIRDVQSGDTEAFRFLVERYQGPIYNLMLRSGMERETAADLAQETFTKAYAAIGRFNASKRFFPWLYAIGMNLLRDHMRKSGREYTGLDPDCLGEGVPPVDMQTRLDGQRMANEIERLPEAYREALVLRFREDCSMKDIAEALSISVSGAKMRVSRGLCMLRKRFGGEQHDQ